MDSSQLKNNACFQKWLEADQKSKSNSIFNYVLHVCDLYNAPVEIKCSVKKSVKLFALRISNYWRLCSRSETALRKKYSVYLNNSFTFNKDVLNYMHNVEHARTSQADNSKRGRPCKSFEDLNRASKKRRVADLLKNRNPCELQFAASVSSEGKVRKDKKMMSPLEALALYTDLDLSYRKYERLRIVINKLHPDTLPSYYSMIKTRNELLPQDIKSDETGSEVNLQELLTKTASSIIQSVESSAFSHFSPLKLICKWGFDGSSGHSNYKQKFTDSNLTDEFLFMTALVPLQLVESNTKLVKWRNDTPSSTFFCRPLQLRFIKESKDVVNNELHRMTTLINNLETVALPLPDTNACFINVNFEMIFTMIDGSICNTVTDINLTQTCYICGATPKLMNEANVVDLQPNQSTYKYGLSTLHNWIRSFECILHIGYRLPLKCWQVRGPANKQVFEENKKRIQKEFKEKMGLLVDKPKPGYGSTNDGNTARTFFRQSSLSAEITGVKEDLIVKFSMINRILSSGMKINLEKFRELLADTKTSYLSSYSWYYMPMSIHKVLIHGPDVIESFVLPIGQLSEDALEGRHKDSRNLREHHTRKSSRINTNKDLMNMMLLTSDPLISAIRNKMRNFQPKLIEEDIMAFLETTS